MKCSELLSLLNEYVDGTVDPLICEEFEKHMAGCNPCQVVVDNVRKTITLYKAGQPVELPVEFQNRLHAVLRSRWEEIISPRTERASRFDESAAQWDSNPTRVELTRAIAGKIVETVPIQPDWRTLDFGAGTGLVTLALQPRVQSVLAVDTSAGMLSKLSEKLAVAGIDNVTTRQWDLLQAPFPETGFDLCFSSMTLHHLPDVPLAFRRFAQLLRPGGWLAVADLDTEDGSFHGTLNDVFHHGFDRKEIAAWLAQAGFESVVFRDAHQISKPDASGIARQYGVFLATAKLT